MILRRYKYMTMCLCTAALTGLTACSDMMDTDSDLVEFQEDNRLGSPTDSVYSVMGIIHKMQVLADRTVVLGEIRGDLTATTAYADADLKAVAEFDVQEDNKYNQISDYYAVINNCNYFLTNIDTTLTKRGRKVFEAEFAAVKAFRAWTYFQAALVYGSVPLITEPLLTESAAQEAVNMPYSSITEICNYFIDDIRPYVDTPLPQYGTIGNYESSRFFIPVRALLGDLCLWAGRYQEAATYYHDYLTLREAPRPTYVAQAYWQRTNKDFKDVIDAYTLAFGLTATECLSYIPMETSDFDGVYSQLSNIFSSTQANYYYVQAEASPALISLSAAQNYCMEYKVNDMQTDTVYAPKENPLVPYGAGDLRLNTTYSKRANNQDYGSKYSSEFQTVKKFQSTGIMTYRTAVVYLHYAEALNRAGYPQSAFTILKYGLCSTNIAKYVDEEERTAAGNLISFDQNVFTESNTQGIHARGCGDVYADKTYAMPQPDRQLASRADTVEWQIPMVEDLIVIELALETAFEGQRYYDLMRVALRRGDADYLAGPVSRRNGTADGALYSKLLNKENWYLTK